MLVRTLRRFVYDWTVPGMKNKKRPAGRPRARLCLEALEDRLVLSSAQLALLVPVAPLVPAGEGPFGTAMPDLPAAEVEGLYRLLLGREPDAAGQTYWTAVRQSGADLATITGGFLKSPEYTANVVEGYYARFLGRAAEPAGLGYWTAVWQAFGDTGMLVTGFASSPEYSTLRPTDGAFVRSLYTDILGREAADPEVGFWQQVLSAGVGRDSVAAAVATSDEALNGTVEQLYETFLQRPAEPAGLAYWVAVAKSETLSLALGQLLSAPEFQFRAAAGTAGQSFDNFFGLNQQTLVPDSVTDAAASGAGSVGLGASGDATAGGLVPRNSPWGQAVVFPSVPYNAVATGTAAQPTLQLPDLVSPLDLAHGGEGTFQIWFQAKNPGVLLAANFKGDPAPVSAPLVYINGNGNLVAGLFDQTALALVPHQSPLSWKDAGGQTQVGAAHPLVSQVGVVDNTWHHVAFVFSAHSEALYLDGLLQGMSQPRYQLTTGNLTSNSTTLTVTLDPAPSPDQMVSGTVTQLNPAGDAQFGPGGSSQIARFQGWLPSTGGAILNLTPTSESSTVTSVSYSPASGSTKAMLTFTLTGSIESANALSVGVSYLTADSAYSFQPAAASTWSTPVQTLTGTSLKPTLGDVTGLTVGGTVFPEPTSKPHPALNYPQGFVGTVDELALWKTSLSQAQVQLAMSGPVGGPGGDVQEDKLVGFFPFTSTVPGKTNEWPNVAPGANTFATGPTQGTLLTPAGSTIPTDPFPDAKRLADVRTGVPTGFRTWGLNLMTPLASPSVNLDSGKSAVYKVGLAAGDQLAISLAQAQTGSLTVVVEDDLGRTYPAATLTPGLQPQYLVAARTGTYQLTLTWTATSPGQVDFGLIPGPLNSLMELFTSYVEGVSSAQTNTLYAYSDPALPGINPKVGTTGPADYWPLWDDPKYFPRSLQTPYAPADLNAAYGHLRNTLLAMNVGLTDFANLNGAGDTNPNDLQQFLHQAYKTFYQTDPPTAPGPGPFFPVGPEQTAQDAVYKFFYNANVLRGTVYAVLTGQGSKTPSDLKTWVQRAIDSISGASNVPLNIATTIAAGQGQQVTTIPVTVPQAGRKKPIEDVLIGGAIQVAAGLLSAIPVVGPIGGALLRGGAAIATSFVDNAFAAGAGTLSFTVPVTPITNSQLNYEHLSNMAGSIQAGAQQLWNNIYKALTTSALAESVLSNFGLLQAFSAMSGAPLSYQAADPSQAITTSLAQSSWQEMIPATFHWTPVAPDAFPTGNGQTNDWAASGPYSLGGERPFLNGMTSADFNKDGKPDLAVANFDSSNVSILLGQPGGTFPNTATTLGLNDGGGAAGVTGGDFNRDGNPDLVVSDFSADELSILLGNGDGRFKPAQVVGLNGLTQPQGLVNGDFNNDGKLDLAVADFGGRGVFNHGFVSVLLGHGDGTFQTAQFLGLNLSLGETPISVAVGHFTKSGNLDLALTIDGGANNTGNSAGYVTVLLGGGDGSFASPLALHDPSGQYETSGITVGRLRGDQFPDDIAVTNENTNTVTVWLGKGDGTFEDPTDYPLAPGSSGPSGIALEASAGGPPDLVVASHDSNNLNIFFNKGNGEFYPAISIPESGSRPRSIVVADFAGIGLEQVAVANAVSNDVVVLTPTGVGNTATFLPGTVNPVALDKLLAQTESLQGGNTAHLGPFNNVGRIIPTGAGNTPPNFMAFTSLTYPSNSVPLSLNAPGMFLSLSPATLHEMAKTGGTPLDYRQDGVYLAGWQLRDSNKFPMAPATQLKLFGTPSLDANKRPKGVDLTPVNPNQPFTAFNGGWYFDAEPVNGAAATWEEAFFDWGLGTSDYSPRNLSPSVPLTGSLPNTATPNVTAQDIAYQLTFQPATDSPPPIQVGVPVSLTNSLNLTGIVNDRRAFSPSGGIDGAGFALSGELLGRTVIANGTQFTLEPPGGNNVVVGTGQSIPLPPGSFSNLNVLATGVGTLPETKLTLNFMVNYADGSSQAISQPVTNWAGSGNTPGEVTAATMVYRDKVDGSSETRSVRLFAYRFALDPQKSVKSITLANVASTDRVAVLALTLT